MSAMPKIKFAVLESSLLARKGSARPAMPTGPGYEETVLRTDADPLPEFSAADDYLVDLASLITRPVPVVVLTPRAAPQPVAVPEAVAAPDPAPDASLVSGLGHAGEPEPEAELTPESRGETAAEAESISDIIRAWTQKVTRDRRVATNLHPRGLNRDQAARYVGLSLTTFLRLVAEGYLPAALHFGRRRVWDRRALDEALDHLSGIARRSAPVA
jgi:excisionase family DNA binding protein